MRPLLFCYQYVFPQVPYGLIARGTIDKIQDVNDFTRRLVIDRRRCACLGAYILDLFLRRWNMAHDLFKISSGAENAEPRRSDWGTVSRFVGPKVQTRLYLDKRPEKPGPIRNILQRRLSQKRKTGAGLNHPVVFFTFSTVVLEERGTVFEQR